ncbi:MAG TPA: response regulator [Fimbriimonadaceae bacterium]|nr:response regulator [Fimbriimonadaceae bacterium]
MEVSLSKTVLVVDDSASMRQMVAFTLKSAGLAVIESANGQEALSKLTAPLRVDLIITDLNMPVMDGLTFIRQARGKPNLRFTPILMLTTESQESRKMEGKAAGATGWIVKPFQPEQLLKVIQKVMPA